MHSHLLAAAAILMLLPVTALAQTAPGAMPTTPPPVPVAASAAPVTPAASPAPSVAPDGSVTMRYKYVQGQVLKYHFTSSESGTIQVMGHDLPIASQISSDMSMTVKQVDADGNATMVSQLISPTMTTTVNGKNIATPGSASDSMTKGFSTVMNPYGKVVSMDAAGLENPGAAAAVDPTHLFDSTRMGGVSVLPGHPVKMNDVWRGAMDMGQLGMKMFIKNALIGMAPSGGHNIATIATRYYADISPKDVTGLPQGMHITGQLTGNGHNKFDVDGGYLNNTSQILALDMRMIMPSNPQANMVSLGAMNLHLTISTNEDLISAS